MLFDHFIGIVEPCGTLYEVTGGMYRGLVGPCDHFRVCHTILFLGTENIVVKITLGMVMHQICTHKFFNYSRITIFNMALSLGSKSISESYKIMDAFEYMRSFKTGTIRGVITSPPYNKQFRRRGGKCSNWANSKLMADNYAQYNDDMKPEQYVAWQRQFLTEALRLVGDEGVILYNIGRHIKNLKEDRRQSIIEGYPTSKPVSYTHLTLPTIYSV